MTNDVNYRFGYVVESGPTQNRTGAFNNASTMGSLYQSRAAEAYVLEHLVGLSINIVRADKT